MAQKEGYTLFLDRDGVINQRLIGDYVTKPQQFVLIDGVLDALQTFTSVFERIVVVTNQQGIGKGLMTDNDLNEVHKNFLSQVEACNAKIDKIYYCPNLERENNFCRKPNIGMALKAKKDFPEIRFKNSVMIGDSMIDMKFGKRAGMKTILIGDRPEIAFNYPTLVDYYFPSLLEASKNIDKLI